jgi:putative membrane protein
MGTADVIPGVSGGTMAFILGIYAELINAIKSFDSNWLLSVLKLDVKSALGRPHFGFLIPLLSGIVFALLFFTRVIPLPELLLSYPEHVYGLFFGLIVGSCVVLIANTKKLTPIDMMQITAGIITGFLIFNLGPFSTPDTSLYIFLSGCLAISAMLLPGISGSFILLILNKYAFIFNAIGYFKFSVIIPFAVGMLTGLAIFSRLLSWVLHHYYRQTTLVITGFLIASLWLIWPYQDRAYETIGEKTKLISSTPYVPSDINTAFLSSLGLAVLGMCTVLIINSMARKNKT